MQFSSHQLHDIPHILSEPRFATYLQHCDGDRNRALELYQWNLELSAAFIIPLHLLEVSLRNAVAQCLTKVHTSNWPWNKGFINTLPDSPKLHLNNTAKMQNPTMGKVVAELNFVFWENMFTKRHDKTLWIPHIKTAFPYADLVLPPWAIRSKIYDNVTILRKLRNRIAHHEPIFYRNIQDDYNKIYELIAWRSTITAKWMHDIQTVTKLISQFPLKDKTDL